MIGPSQVPGLEGRREATLQREEAEKGGEKKNDARTNNVVQRHDLIYIYIHSCFLLSLFWRKLLTVGREENTIKKNNNNNTENTNIGFEYGEG